MNLRVSRARFTGPPRGMTNTRLTKYFGTQGGDNYDSFLLTSTMALHTLLDHSSFFSASFLKTSSRFCSPLKLWVGLYPKGEEWTGEALAGVIYHTNSALKVVSHLPSKPWMVRTCRSVFQSPVLTFYPSYHRSRIPRSVRSLLQGKESGRARFLLERAQRLRHRRTYFASLSPISSPSIIITGCPPSSSLWSAWAPILGSCPTRPEAYPFLHENVLLTWTTQFHAFLILSRCL